MAASTARHPSLTGRERAFLACLAPRGIVAAATAALFTLRLEQIGEPSEVRQGVPAVLVARGRADLEDRDDLPFVVHTGLLRELSPSGLLDDVAGAVIASRDDEADLLALGVLVDRLGRRNVWMLPSVPAPASTGVGTPASGGRQVRTGEDEGLAAVESWAQRPFAPGVTHRRLDAAVAAGHQPRTVASGAVPDDALVLVVLSAGEGGPRRSAPPALLPTA